MNERWVTVILLLALVLQGIFIFLPSVPASWQIVPLLVFGLSAAYMVLQAVAAGPEAEASRLSSPGERGADFQEDFYSYSADRYGVGYGWLDIDCMIRQDGSAKVHRTVTVEAHSEVDKLDTFLMIPESAPKGEERIIDLVEARAISPGYDVALDIPEKRQRTLYAVMEISPHIKAENTFRYEMTEQLPRGLFAIDLSDEEMEKRETEYDYFGWNINRPTREMSLTVYFPEQVKPKVYDIEVRLAPAVPGMPERFEHQKEKARLEKLSLEGPEGGRYFLKQTVRYPMIGLIYLLRWEPLETR